MIKLIPRDLLIKTISNDDLIVDNEHQVLEAILMWYINNNGQSSEELFDNIRFGYISKEHQKMILNQIEFEFNSYAFKQNKAMHQHECNNKFKPRENFNYL